MGSTFGGLEIGKRSLFAQQSALNTVSHNIANANTEGYTRQRAVMRATEAYPNPSMNNPVIPGQLGTGVMVTGIQRLRDQFLDQQFYGQNMDFGSWETKSNLMTQVENIVGEPSDTGLQNAMDQFWQSWQSLASDPTNTSAQKLVVERANTLTTSFNQISAQFTDLQNQIGSTADMDIDPTTNTYKNTMIGNKTKEINDYADQIKDLNERIAKNIENGYTPNDLYDQRNLVLDQLSKAVNIDVTPVTDAKGSDTGMINVTIKNPAGSTLNLVSGKSTTKLSSANINSVTGGELKSLLDMVDPTNGTIPKYVGQIDALANDLTTKFNATSGITLFTNGTKAATIGVSTTASTDLNSVVSVNTADATTKADELNQSYQQTITQLGLEAQEASRFMSNAEASKNAVDNNRQSVSGVSLDEEMTDMIKYQHAYSAASRTITTMDEMLDKLINGTGKVGL